MNNQLFYKKTKKTKKKTKKNKKKTKNIQKYNRLTKSGNNEARIPDHSVIGFVNNLQSRMLKK